MKVNTAMIKDIAIKQKQESLYSFTILKKENIDRFIDAIKPLDDWKLYRMNPIAFAKDNNFSSNESIELFIHGSKVGLFDLRFNMVCPMCGGVASSHENLNQVEAKDFYCATCNASIESTLDDRVEVNFAIHPSIKKIEIDPTSNAETYLGYHFSHNFNRSPELQNYGSENLFGFKSLKSDESIDLELNPSVSNIFQVICIEKNSNVFIHYNDENAASHPHVDLLSTGFSPRKMNLSFNTKKISIHNRSKEHLAFTIITPKLDKLNSIMRDYPTKVQPYFTAKMLLNNQSFRDLYRTQDLSSDLSLNIKSLTIMFTDLRGSTEMYDRAGDILAYQLVQEHFKILMETVRKYSGTVVKTMGDAIMATFSKPEDGLLTSLEMMLKIESLNGKWRQKGYEIGLKVGIHEGSALAVVNDERLDYFGHSVNVAARVQGLAKAGEVWITDKIFSNLNVVQMLKERNLLLEKNKAILKGVGEEATVYKLTVAV
jgi:class 3 adenylate cyclase